MCQKALHGQKKKHVRSNLRGGVIAHVSKSSEGHYKCDCGQDKDLGTPCPHILSIEEVKAEDYTHEIWTTNTFNCHEENVVTSGRATTISPTSHQMKIISAVRAAGTISNGTTNAILALLKHKE